MLCRDTLPRVHVGIPVLLYGISRHHCGRKLLPLLEREACLWRDINCSCPLLPIDPRESDFRFTIPGERTVDRMVWVLSCRGTALLPLLTRQPDAARVKRRIIWHRPGTRKAHHANHSRQDGHEQSTTTEVWHLHEEGDGQSRCRVHRRLPATPVPPYSGKTAILAQGVTCARRPHVVLNGDPAA